MQRFKKTIILTITSLVLMVGLMGWQFTGVASADAATDASKNAACRGIGGTPSGGKCSVGGPSLNRIIATAINIISIIVGIAAVIMIMVGGFKYITSGGDSSNLASAKNTIIYAVIGLIIVALAQAIVQFVVKTSTDPPADNDTKSTQLHENAGSSAAVL
ncbi:MAG TPA: pilin [Candidatus Saccharimonadales bacterium]|nr:pilin [Candidatus Saccharimonadales bacterium]